MEPKTKDNDILDKMMSAAKDSVSNIDDSPLRDAAMIVNGNQVEHYEMAHRDSAKLCQSLRWPSAQR
jgi:ferritin-like metal-binding protein YciE